MRLYVVYRLYRWSTLSTADGKELTFPSATGVGFLPVFDSLDTLEREYPGAFWMEIETAPDSYEEEAHNAD